MACTSQPSPMPHRASKRGGRSGHGLRFPCGTAAPEAVMQPQSGQRHTQSPTCTSDPGFRAHRGLFHMCGPRTAPDARPDSEQPSLKLRRARHAVRSGTNRTWTTGHWSNNPSQANFPSRRSCSPSTRNRMMARTEKTSALPTSPANGGPQPSEKCDSLIGKPALVRKTAAGFTRPPGQRNCGSEFRDGSSDLYFPTPAGTTVQELLGVRQALAARALVARAVVMLDDAGRRDVQLGLRPLGSSLAHHKDVCASMGAEKPTPPMTLASNKACRAVPVRDRIPQLNKRRASAIEPSRLNANWPIQHPRCTNAPS